MRFKGFNVSDPNLSQTLYRELENKNFLEPLEHEGTAVYGALNADGEFILSDICSVMFGHKNLTAQARAEAELLPLLRGAVLFTIRGIRPYDFTLERKVEGFDSDSMLRTISIAYEESQSRAMKNFMRLVSADTAQRGEILREIYRGTSGDPIERMKHMKQMLLLSRKKPVETDSQKREKEEMNLLLANAIEAFELIFAVTNAICSVKHVKKEEDVVLLSLMNKKLKDNLSGAPYSRQPSEGKCELTEAQKITAQLKLRELELLTTTGSPDLSLKSARDEVRSQCRVRLRASYDFYGFSYIQEIYSLSVSSQLRKPGGCPNQIIHLCIVYFFNDLKSLKEMQEAITALRDKKLDTLVDLDSILRNALPEPLRPSESANNRYRFLPAPSSSSGSGSVGGTEPEAKAPVDSEEPQCTIKLPAGSSV